MRIPLSRELKELYPIPLNAVYSHCDKPGKMLKELFIAIYSHNQKCCRYHEFASSKCYCEIYIQINCLPRRLWFLVALQISRVIPSITWLFPSAFSLDFFPMRITLGEREGDCNAHCLNQNDLTQVSSCLVDI